MTTERAKLVREVLESVISLSENISDKRLTRSTFKMRDCMCYQDLIELEFEDGSKVLLSSGSRK